MTANFDETSRFNVHQKKAQDFADEKKDIAKESMKRMGVTTRGPGSGMNGQGFGAN